LLGVPPLWGYNYITSRRAGLSATARLSCTPDYMFNVRDQSSATLVGRWVSGQVAVRRIDDGKAGWKARIRYDITHHPTSGVVSEVKDRPTRRTR